jgi:hypothetical protein
MADQVSELFKLIADLAIARNLHPLHKHPDCCEIVVDENWTIAVNGHREPRKYKDVTVEPFCAYVEWCGWPAGIIGIAGGMIAAGELANEAALCEALKKATEEAI